MPREARSLRASQLSVALPRLLVLVAGVAPHHYGSGITMMLPSEKVTVSVVLDGECLYFAVNV